MQPSNPYQSPQIGPESAVHKPQVDPGFGLTSLLFAIARRMAALLIGCLLLLLVTGLPHGSDLLAYVHRWTGHVLLILLWICIPFAVVALSIAKLWRFPLTTFGQGIVLLLVIPVMLTTSFTGYLGPSYDASMNEETRVRFLVLHCFILPTLLTSLLVAWFFIFRSRHSEPRSGGSQ